MESGQKIRIIALNLRDASMYAEKHSLKNWKYVSNPEMLRGISGIKIIYLSNWEHHPHAYEIDQIAEYLISSGRAEKGKSEYNEHETNMARFLRVGMIRNILSQNLLDRDQALELLAGCLEPGDESTRVDDRELLDKSAEEVMEILNIHPKDLSTMEDKNA